MVLSVKKIDLDTWLKNAKFFNDYNYTHYWEYSRMSAERIGGISENIAFLDSSNNIIGLSNIRIKLAPFGLGGVAYISNGPMVVRSDYSEKSILSDVLDALKHEYVTKKGLILRVSQSRKIDALNDIEAQIYFNSGFINYEKTNRSILIDINRELADIRSGFHQKWRNMLNKSEKKDISIISGYDSKLFLDFSLLFSDLLEQKSFSVDMDDKYFASIQKRSEQKERFYLAVAYVDGKPISGHLSSMCGDTSVYILGATNNDGRSLGAAYLLQWNAILESKRSNCKWYDLGGIDQDSNPNVYRFKKRMGGIETQAGNVFQFRQGLKGWVILLLEKIYRLYRN